MCDGGCECARLTWCARVASCGWEEGSAEDEAKRGREQISHNVVGSVDGLSGRGFVPEGDDGEEDAGVVIGVAGSETVGFESTRLR